MLAEIFMLRSEAAIRKDLDARSRSSTDERFVPIKLPNPQPSPTPTPNPSWQGLPAAGIILPWC